MRARRHGTLLRSERCGARILDNNHERYVAWSRSGLNKKKISPKTMHDRETTLKARQLRVGRVSGFREVANRSERVPLGSCQLIARESDHASSVKCVNIARRVTGGALRQNILGTGIGRGSWDPRLIRVFAVSLRGEVRGVRAHQHRHHQRNHHHDHHHRRRYR